jgi:hypothetical protein
VYFEDVHTGLPGVHSGTPSTWESGDRHTAQYF